MEIAAAALLAPPRPLTGRIQEPTPDDQAAFQAVEARARQAGIGPLHQTRTNLYLGAGDAAPDFQALALNLCEALAKDFIKHFLDRAFDVHLPQKRLTVVILANPDSFASFLGQNPGEQVRGIYDLDADWLVMCDSRGIGGPLAERANTVTLFHEATHQLCFHANLLERAGDIPLLISEGLATYGETRRPDGRTRVGAVNHERLAVLRNLARSGAALTTTTDLITQDALLNRPETQQVAYAQAWLLIHWHMQKTERQRRLAAYLTAIRTRRDPSKRLDDARAHLGDLNELDAELKRYANTLLKR